MEDKMDVTSQSAILPKTMASANMLPSTSRNASMPDSFQATRDASKEISPPLGRSWASRTCGYTADLSSLNCDDSSSCTSTTRGRRRFRKRRPAHQSRSGQHITLLAAKDTKLFPSPFAVLQSHRFSIGYPPATQLLLQRHPQQKGDSSKAQIQPVQFEESHFMAQDKKKPSSDDECSFSSLSLSGYEDCVGGDSPDDGGETDAEETSAEEDIARR